MKSTIKFPVPISLAWMFMVILTSTPMATAFANGTHIGFELTGTVTDAVTKKPIEGAYVMASYRKAVVGPAASTSWCVKTRGMYTGSDGRYRFPVEKLDGRSPFDAIAIKPGYFRGDTAEPPPDVWKKQGAAAYSGRDITLNPQDPAKAQFVFGTGDQYCDHAATREDGAAGLEFTKIELRELIRLGASPRGIQAIQRLIENLESLPHQSATTK